MSDTTTAREAIAEALYFAGDHSYHTDQLLDAYRDQVLTEAAELLFAEVRSHRYCAEKLLAARSIGLPEHERPVVLCELPHHVAADTWCALPIEHDGWHQDETGDRWPNLLLAARTTTKEAQR
jgi:hypothetical protein